MDSTGRALEADREVRRPPGLDRQGRTDRVGTVSVRVLWPDGRSVSNKRYRDRVSYRVDGRRADEHHRRGADRDERPAVEWDQRVGEVGAGLAARRIFADLAAGATSQIKLVEAAHAAGMLPVISYKVGGDIAGAVRGKYNAVAEQAAAKLASFGLPTAVTFWHEPNPDMTGGRVRRGEPAAAADLQAWRAAGRSAPERVAAGPPAGPCSPSYCPEDLFDLWDWVGHRHLRGRRARRVQASKPADRIPALRRS